MKRTYHNHFRKPSGFKGQSHQGFSLIVTVTMMVLLSMIAIGLLTLSSTVLRSANHSSAQEEAKANARMALMLALGELQKTAGPDQRVTADGSILSSGGNVSQPHAVGVWQSWSPRFTNAPSQASPNYDSEHDTRFLRWLVSGPTEEVESLSWAQGGATDVLINLFRENEDGFNLSGEKLEITGDNTGELAWAVSQEATKAKVTVAGEETSLQNQNDKLHAQLRPTLGASEFLKEPTDDQWNRRSAVIVDRKQLELENSIWKGDNSKEGFAHYTTSSMGLMTDVVNGGLKTDLNLGFEMDDSDFRSTQWSADGVSIPNPFHADNSDFNVPSFYANQQPLYEHQGDSRSGTYRDNDLLGNFDVAKAQFEFPIYCAPTFDLLRSHYRTYKNVFNGSSGPTIFERTMDHVAGAPSGRMQGGYYPPPALYMDGRETQTGYKPILDRSLFIVSSYVSRANQVAFMFTPVITLWNPYNVSLEIEGAVSYIWLDIPFRADWNYYQGGRRVGGHGKHFSSMGFQFQNVSHGRSINPYFYGAVTATGAPLSEGANPTITFEPGEVRIFVPATNRAIEFRPEASIRARTVFLKPVESAGDLANLDGGIYVPQTETAGIVPNGADVEMIFSSVTGEDFPFFISLEDATRAKGTNPNHEQNRGQPIADILSRYFARSGTGANTARYTSPQIASATLKREPYPVCVLESYHRTALQSTQTGSQKTDIVYTNNPRQPWMTDKVTNLTGQAGGTGPQYETRVKALSGVFSNFLGGLSGRNTFYGATNDASGGRTHLSFFEVPTSPMLSLGGFQHCDMSSTTASAAYQFGNSWPSAYVRSSRVVVPGRRGAPTMIDHSYLVNEALWDKYFFSGAAPYTQPGNAASSKSEAFWDNPIARESRSVQAVIQDFLKDPEQSPLRNPRMKLYKGDKDDQDLIRLLTDPAGAAAIAGYLMYDGPFNVNSTSVEAWKAVLGGLRNVEFELADGSTERAGENLQPRMQYPTGKANDNWDGFRTLSDGDIEALAENIVVEVQSRGPFLSLGEFVNRRVDEEMRPGAVQAAIDSTNLNRNAMQDTFDTSGYDRSSSRNINPANTGVGIPGYLTQADVLQSMAPSMTVRSDTFTIRTYGASTDRNGQIIATAWAEAVVQRYPEFVDKTDPPYAIVPREDGTGNQDTQLSTINKNLGRQFKVVSFRYLSRQEIEA